MFRSSVLRMLAVVFICLSSLGVNPAAAQNSGDNYLAMTAARTCDDNSVIIRWETVDVDTLRFSLSNTSDNWTSGWIGITDIANKVHTEPVDHNYDKVMLEATFADGTTVQRDANVGACVDDIGMVPIPDAPPGGQTEATSTISGHVTDENGNSLSGVAVCARINALAFSTCVSSGVSGNYVIPNVPDGEGYVRAYRTGFEQDRLDFSSLGNALIFNPVLESRPMVILSGQVSGVSGTPLPGVRICSYALGSTDSSCARTNGQGVYSFSVRPNSAWRVFSGDPAWSFDSLHTSEPIAQVADNDVTFDLTAIPIENPAEPSEDLATLVGRLVDINDHPIVQFTICETISGRNGTHCDSSGGDTNQFEWSSGNGVFYDVRVHVEGCPITFVADFNEGTLTPGVHDLGTFKVDCEAGIAPPSETPVVTPTHTSTPTETVVPTETVSPTETETPVIGENALIVTINLPDGASIEGAPFNLYAEQASIQFQTEPYRSGIVGANNTIKAEDLLPGTYKLVISPEGMSPIEAVIEVGDQPLTEVRLIVSEDGSVTVEEIAQVAPTTAPKDDKVTSLPSTGTGTLNGPMGIAALLAIAASSLLLTGGLAVRQRRG